MEPGETEEARYQRIAQELKAKGYTGAVVSSRLISEHGMEEASAVALVSRLYGRPVNPRQGAILLDVSAGLVELVAGGWVLAWYGAWGVLTDGWVAAVLVTVDGARRLLRGLMRTVANEDLRRPPAD